MLFVAPDNKWIKIISNPRGWQDKFLVYNFFAAFTLLLIIWGEVIWALFTIKGATFLSLHYSIYFGVDWIGSLSSIFIFTFIATTIFILNFILSNIVYEKNKLLSYFLSGSASMLELLLLVAVSLIVYINWATPVIN